MSWSKHVGGRNTYAVDFADSLATGETLTGPPLVRVVRQGVDVTAQFVAGDPTTNGTEVRVVLASAAPGEQAAGVYTVYAECGTSAGNKAVATLHLVVSAEGQA